MEKQAGIFDNPGNGPVIPELKVIKGITDTDIGNEMLTLTQELKRLFHIGQLNKNVIVFSKDTQLKFFGKRLLDILFSIFVIVFFLSWITPLIALFIKLDSRGPVFFLQKRNKRNGKIFICIKFRTMIVNAEADKLPASDFDKRITRVGRFLRDHYLDELPQFFNVLMGEMSIVGPRPHMISDNELYMELIDHYHLRYKVKPGITGLAQVMGYTGNNNDIQRMKNRVYLDIFYVRHHSSLMDIKILWLTLLKMI